MSTRQGSRISMTSRARNFAYRPWMSAILMTELQQWVEMTHPRVAAYRHRTFNAGFLAMNPKARPSQPDPELPFGLLQSCPSPGPASFRFCVREAAARDHQDPAICRRSTAPPERQDQTGSCRSAEERSGAPGQKKLGAGQQPFVWTENPAIAEVEPSGVKFRKAAGQSQMISTSPLLPSRRFQTALARAL
jgi:hypothetical protein